MDPSVLTGEVTACRIESTEAAVQFVSLFFTVWVSLSLSLCGYCWIGKTLEILFTVSWGFTTAGNFNDCNQSALSSFILFSLLNLNAHKLFHSRSFLLAVLHNSNMRENKERKRNKTNNKPRKLTKAQKPKKCVVYRRDCPFFLPSFYCALRSDRSSSSFTPPFPRFPSFSAFSLYFFALFIHSLFLFRWNRSGPSSTEKRLAHLPRLRAQHRGDLRERRRLRCGETLQCRCDVLLWNKKTKSGKKREN